MHSKCTSEWHSSQIRVFPCQGQTNKGRNRIHIQKQINKALMLRIHVNLSKGQTREMPEIEHARSNLAKKIKDSGIYQYIVRYGRIANKYFRKFTASSICCIALLNFLILTNWYYLWHCVYVCYTLRTIQGALHSYKVQSYVQPAACLSVVGIKIHLLIE